MGVWEKRGWGVGWNVGVNGIRGKLLKYLNMWVKLSCFEEIFLNINKI